MSFRLPLALQLFSLLPAGASAYRVSTMLADATPTASPFEAAIHAQPLVFVGHILSATVFAMLAAFQVAPRFRAQYPKAHRVLGRIAWAAGVVMAASGIWLVLGRDLITTVGH